MSAPACRLVVRMVLSRNVGAARALAGICVTCVRGGSHRHRELVPGSLRSSNISATFFEPHESRRLRSRDSEHTGRADQRRASPGRLNGMVRDPSAHWRRMGDRLVAAPPHRGEGRKTARRCLRVQKFERECLPPRLTPFDPHEPPPTPRDESFCIFPQLASTCPARPSSRQTRAACPGDLPGRRARTDVRGGASRRYAGVCCRCESGRRFLRTSSHFSGRGGLRERLFTLKS